MLFCRTAESVTSIVGVQLTGSTLITWRFTKMRRRMRAVLVAVSAAAALMVTTTQAAEKPIKIGIIGPMAFVQGENHWAGAELARDEINKAGGIKGRKPKAPDRDSQSGFERNTKRAGCDQRHGTRADAGQGGFRHRRIPYRSRARDARRRHGLQEDFPRRRRGA